MIAFSRFLRYFFEVAKLGSIRKASERLNVSASAIDRQILAAEEEFGVPLFERLPSGLKVTAAGELLLTATGRWVREFSRLQSQIDELKGLRRGHVRIAAIDALGKGFLPRIIRDIGKEYPGLGVQVTVVDNVLVETILRRGDADFGLMLNPRSSRDIVVHAHRDIVLGLAALPDHALAKQAVTRFSRCVDFPLIAPAEPLALCEQVQALEVATGISLKPVMSSDNIEMIKSLVREGAGIGILTSLDVMEEVERGYLSFIPMNDAILKPIPLALCVERSRQLSQAARLLMARVEQELLKVDEPELPFEVSPAKQA